MQQVKSDNPNLLRIKRTIYSKIDFKEIQQNADNVGAHIINTKLPHNGAGITIILELDISKRQF